MYGEDLDLCWRFHRAGFSTLLCNSALVIHHGGGSSRVAQSTFAVVHGRDSMWKLIRAARGKAEAALYVLGTALVATARIVCLFVVFPLASGRTGRRWWLAALRKWWGALGWALGTPSVRALLKQSD